MARSAEIPPMPFVLSLKILLRISSSSNSSNAGFKPFKSVISGIVQEEEAGSGGRPKIPKPVRGAGVSARRVQNTGRGKEEILTLISYRFTNEEGEFSLTNLPHGNYRLNIQYPGLPMDENSFINFTIGTGL
ncbi:MAG: carboxypeptidase-like regulatory domain-containing protein, partial [Leptospira bouyouniensis]